MELVDAVVYDSMQPLPASLQAGQPWVFTSNQDCQSDFAADRDPSSGSCCSDNQKQETRCSDACHALRAAGASTTASTASSGLARITRLRTRSSKAHVAAAAGSCENISKNGPLQDAVPVPADARPDAMPVLGPGVLQFDSHFESGNLRMAVHVRDHEYDLVMSNDLNDR